MKPIETNKNIRRALSRIPENYNRYVDPYIGMGSMLLTLEPKNAIIADSVWEYINLWTCLRDDADETIETDAMYYETPFSYTYYEQIRDVFRNGQRRVDRNNPLPDPFMAGTMLWLVRNSDHNNYHTNKSGLFDCQPGTNFTYKPNTELRRVTEYLRGNDIEILYSDFSPVVGRCKAGDLLYVGRKIHEYDIERFHHDVSRLHGVHVVE